MIKLLSKAILTFENVIVIGDFNIDVKRPGLSFDSLDTFCNVFNLTNKINSDTWFMRNHKPRINRSLTKKSFE